MITRWPQHPEEEVTTVHILNHPIEGLLVAHEQASRKPHDRAKLGGLERKIADSIQKDTDARLGDQFHVRVILYPGKKP